MQEEAAKTFHKSKAAAHAINAAQTAPMGHNTTDAATATLL